MFVLLKNELIKTFKARAMQVFLIVLGILAILLNLFVTQNGNFSTTRGSVPIQFLYFFSTTCIFFIFAALGGYTLGMEFKFNTLKIIKAKSMRDGRFILTKLIVAIIYVTLMTAEVVAITIIFSLFYPVGEVVIANPALVMSHSEAMLLLGKMIGLLWLGNIYAIMLSILIIALTRKLELGILLSMIIIVFSVIGSFLIKGTSVHYFLPISNYDGLNVLLIENINIMKVVLQRVGYSLILALATVIAYIHMQLD